MNKKYFLPAVIAVIAALTFFAAYAKQQRNNLPIHYRKNMTEFIRP